MQAIIHNSAVEDYLPNHWINWCRLCAKEDKHHNINFLYQNDDYIDNQNKKLSIQEALEKYFCLHTSLEDSLPKMLCINCLSLVSSMINFNERVARVQLMFSHLVEAQTAKNCLNLNTVRLKFDVTEFERDHWFYNYSLTEVDKKCNELTIVENSQQSADDEKFKAQIKEEYTEKLLAIDCDKYMEQEMLFDDNVNDLFPEDEEDPFHHNEKQVKSSSDEGEHEETLQSPSNKNDPKQMSNLDRSKKKRKKFKQFNTNNCKKKKSPIKDIEIEISCKECKKTFSKYMLYREHMQQQHDHSRSDKHWPCPACDKVLLSIYNLERHVRIHVPLEVRRTIECTECDNRYTSNAQLEKHIRNKHKNEKLFICEECGLCLRTNSNLKQHMLIHTDVAPFECELCKKKFKNKTSLKSHMDTHSPNKHVCNICGFQLNSRATLNRHFLVHSDDMQHKCDYCGKAFKRAKALKNHLLLHTGLKPYSCDFCERTFANGSNCRSHMKKMHPQELAVLEASGNKTHTKNIPKLEALKAVTKAAGNLTPVVTKFSGCFAFGKKPKQMLVDTKEIKQPQKSQQKMKTPTATQNDEKLCTGSPASTPLDLQYMPLAGNTATSVSLPDAKNIKNDLSTSALTTTTLIPNFDNIYQHLLKHNETNLEITQPNSQILPQTADSNVSTPQHNPFYHNIINRSIKTSLQSSPESHQSSMTPPPHDDLSNQSSIQETFYGSIRGTLPRDNFI